MAAELLHHLHNRPVREHGLRKRAVPARAFRIDGHDVPHRAVIRGKLGKRAPRIAPCGCLYLLRNPQPPVPELSCSGVVKAVQHSSGGSGPICQENGFPYDEHAKLRIRDLFQDFLDCRGPLQTNRSRG